MTINSNQDLINELTEFPLEANIIVSNSVGDCEIRQIYVNHKGDVVIEIHRVE